MLFCKACSSVLSMLPSQANETDVTIPTFWSWGTRQILVTSGVFKGVHCGLLSVQGHGSVCHMVTPMCGLLLRYRAWNVNKVQKRSPFRSPAVTTVETGRKPVWSVTHILTPWNHPLP